MLDFSLRGLTGGDWCTLLKNSTEFKTIPVILLSACTNKGIEEETYGSDDFIAKPFNVVDLISGINFLTDGRPDFFLKKSHNKEQTRFIFNNNRYDHYQR